MSRMTKKQREELRKKEIERKRENLKRTYKAYLLYHRYKNITWIAENDIRRKSAKIIVNNYYFTVFRGIEHRCKEKPTGYKIWCNTIASFGDDEYWVLSKPQCIQGSSIETCPFCGADLKHRKGSVVLIKTKRSEEDWQRAFDYSW